MDNDEATYRRERAVTEAELGALVIPTEPDVLAAGLYLETLKGVWEDATESERREMLRLLLDAVYVDVRQSRLVCVEPNPAYVTLFQQVPGLQEKDGSIYLVQSADMCSTEDDDIG